MVIELGNRLSQATAVQALGLVRSFIASSSAVMMDVNSGLYLYEILYARLNGIKSEDLVFAEAAIVVLVYLQNRGASTADSFLVQELYLRVRMIEEHGIEGGIADPDYIFCAVNTKLSGIELRNIPDDWLAFLGQPNQLKRLRNIKNLLGPVSLLRDIGIEKDWSKDWLSIREKLP